MASGEELASLRHPDAKNDVGELRLRLQALRRWGQLALLLTAFMSAPIPKALTQEATPLQEAQVEGMVRDSAGNPVPGASIHLQREEQANSVENAAAETGTAETKTNADGAFAFLAVRAGAYWLKANKPGFRDAIEHSIKVAPAERKHCDLILGALAESSLSSSPSASGSSSAIELDDTPHFIVAGVTDSTGSGGHGSETRMRTGDALAKETVKLESDETKQIPTAASSPEAIAHQTLASESALRADLGQNPRGFEANHRLGDFYFRSGRYREALPLLQAAFKVSPADYANAFDLLLALQACGEFAQARNAVDQMLLGEAQLSPQHEADLHRLLGDLDEKLDDPLAAVGEYERATTLEPSEPNYFAWGAELLLHRAVAPAIEVFGRGTRLHPESGRMLAGLGAALYTSGSVEEAAQRLCAASDLASSDPAPYLFLGEMQESSSVALPCIEEKLSRFVHTQPKNAFANYYYALALWKHERGSENAEALRTVEALLQQASAIDPKFDLPYLQLGNLYFARGAFTEAIAAYQKAVAANPAGSEAHYRLGLAYKRNREESKAQHEFEEYKKLDKEEAAAIERQRRELRQFLFVLKDPTPQGQTLQGQSLHGEASKEQTTKPQAP